MTERVQDGSDEEAVDFLACLGAALIAANDAIGLVRQTLTLACSRYGLSNGFLLLPTYVQFVGFDRAAGTIVRVVSVDRELRFDQTFILAELVERVEQAMDRVVMVRHALASLAALSRRSDQVYRPRCAVDGPRGGEAGAARGGRQRPQGHERRAGPSR